MASFSPPPLARQNSIRKKSAYPRLKYCSIGIDKDGTASAGGGSLVKVDMQALEQLVSAPLPSFSFSGEKVALEKVEMQRAEMLVARSDVESRKADKAKQALEKVRQASEQAVEAKRREEEKKNEIQEVKKEKLQNMDATQMDVMASFEAVTGAQRSVDLYELMELLKWDLNQSIAIYFDNGENVDVCLEKARATVAKTMGVGNGGAKITLVYPDSTEAQETFGRADTLWMVYQKVQASGKIQPVGASIRLTAVNPRTDGMDIYTDAKFDTSIEAAGLFPAGQIRVAYG